MKDAMFIVDKSKKYIIYGAGGDGIKMAGILKDAGVFVWGYIDARAESIGKVKGFSVYTLQKASEEITDKNKFIIIVTIKNLFEHSQIVRRLVEEGFDQCIYKPVETLRGVGNIVQNEIGKVYDELIIRKRLLAGKMLGKSGKGLNLVCRNKLIIETRDESVLVWLPEELIYNYNDFQDAYGCISMSAFFPLVELYQLFMGQYKSEEEVNGVIDNFICYSMEWVKKNGIEYNEGLKLSLIRSRYNVFVEMQRMMETDRDFFVRNAPTVCRGNNGAFYMSSSGRNRVAFLIAHGYHFVPVNMSMEDYRSWINEKIYQGIIMYLEKKEIDILEIPIPHPYLADISARYTEYIHVFCTKVINIVLKQLYKKNRKYDGSICFIDKGGYKKSLEKEQIGCALLDAGCMRRYLAMNGFSASSVEGSNVESFTDMEKMLDILLEEGNTEEQTDKEYTMLIMDSRIGHRLKPDVFREAAQIFLINWREEEDYLQNCLELGFTICEKLFLTVWDCRQVEGYWLKR